MLTDHEMLTGKMPKAWHESLFRKTPDEMEGTAFAGFEEVKKAQAVIDESDTVIGVVSGRHTIVDNREFLSALDIAAGVHGLTVEPTSATYRNGRARYSFQIPELTMQVTGDDSKTSAKLDLRNDHGGTGGLGIDSGYWRWRCTNGMIAGKLSHQRTVRHVGEINVYQFVAEAVAKVKDEFEVHRILAETLAGERHYMYGVDARREQNLAAVNGDKVNPSLVDQIMADTAERYDNYLRTAIRENQRDMGSNLWALTQAVSQTSTHRMPGMNADQWATRQLNRIRQFAGA